MSNDTNQHGLTDDELGGRLRRAAWGWFLLGPLGALIGSSMKANPVNPFTDPTSSLNNPHRTPQQRQRDRKWFIVLLVLGALILLFGH